MTLWTSLLLSSDQIHASGQHKTETCWKVYTDCRGTMFGWNKRRCIVHSQYALCFVGFIAELKAISSSEILRQLFQDWSEYLWYELLFNNCIVPLFVFFLLFLKIFSMETPTSHVLFTSRDFVLCKAGVLLFLASSGHCDLLKFGLQYILSYKVFQKMFNTEYWYTDWQFTIWTAWMEVPWV